MIDSFAAVPCCPHPEALVVVDVVPLCAIDTPEGALVALSAAESLAKPCDPLDVRAGRPVRCVAALSCDEALALLKEAGHVLL